MSLRDKLFPDTNITGHTDSHNKPILVGQRLKDNTGSVVHVLRHEGKYVCSVEAEIKASTLYCDLAYFIRHSETIEIV